MYKVITDFTDLKDANYVYRKGDLYPREGSNPSKARIDFLSGYNNLLGAPVIEEIRESDTEKPEIPSSRRGRRRKEEN